SNRLSYRKRIEVRARDGVSRIERQRLEEERARRFEAPLPLGNDALTVGDDRARGGHQPRVAELGVGFIEAAELREAQRAVDVGRQLAGSAADCLRVGV